MRILHLIPFLWSGAGNVVTGLCESQSASNSVRIVTSGRSKGFTDWPEYRKRLKQADIDHSTIDLFDRDPSVFWESVEALSKLNKQWRPDLIHCHSGVPSCAVAALGVPFIATLHSWGVGRPEWMNTMDLGGFRRAERVLCGAHAYRKILIQGGVPGSRIEYVPWGLKLEKIRAQAAAKASPQSPCRVGFLGRLEPRKGQLDLARAFERFHRRHPDSRLELIGPVADETYAAELRTYIRRDRLDDSIHLLGRVANPFSKLRNWDLFTSLSSDEGQGLAILEAMALGVPVLGRRVSGVEDYLHHRETGMAVTSMSSQEIADQMAWTFDHGSQVSQMARRASKMVERDYSWDRTLEKLEKVYAAHARTHPRLG